MASVTVVGGDTVELPAEIFDVQTNVPLIHQVVVAQLAAARQGTHATKTRGAVSGGGAKPYRQKGTGRARQGSIRAPHYAGGGVVHGPQPRDYSQRTPKRMKLAALRGALSDRARSQRIHVIADFGLGETPSTATVKAVLSEATTRRNVLLVIARSEEVLAKSARNLAAVHTIFVDQLNTYDVMCSDDVVFTQDSYEIFIAPRPVGKGVKAVATESEAAELEETVQVAETAKEDAK